MLTQPTNNENQLSNKSNNVNHTRVRYRDTLRYFPGSHMTPRGKKYQCKHVSTLHVPYTLQRQPEDGTPYRKVFRYWKAAVPFIMHVATSISGFFKHNE